MNSVVLIGNLTKDPELRYTNSQKAVCKFIVAVNDRRMNPNTGQYEDSPSFIPVIVWDRQAENCEKYLSKGRKVAVQGRIKTGSYKKQDGTTVFTTDVVANNVEFLNSNEAQTPQQPTQGAPAQDQPITYRQYQQEQQMQMPAGFAAVDEDVPF